MQANIIHTLSYAKIFNFPLTLKETHKRFIKQKSSLSELKKHISKLGIKSHKGYYFLGDKSQVVERIKNQGHLKKKMVTAHKLANILKVFPSIQAVLLTGAVAAQNPRIDDDIDFLVITNHNSLWITRLFVNILLDMLRLRRTPSSVVSSDKACLNLWLTTHALALPKNKQSLYAAYEISLCIPMWERKNTFQKFLFQNKWIIKYLPNTHIPSKPSSIDKKGGLPGLDLLAFKLQSRYMRSKQTKEIVTKDSAFFHPRNTKEDIEKKYKKIYKQYSKTYLS